MAIFNSYVSLPEGKRHPHWSQSYDVVPSPTSTLVLWARCAPAPPPHRLRKADICRELDVAVVKIRCDRMFELDDGWPESVEEQGLLLLVWRHYITKQYIKDVL
jgi:hypothetical protein